MVVNEVIIYFLTDCGSATKYSEMLEGVTTSKSVQEEIIGELKKFDVKYIILYEEKEFQTSMGATDLIKYIMSNHKPIKTVGN